ADGLQRADRRLAPRPRALDADVERPHAHRLRRVARVERGLRRRERRAFARSLEADAAGARPGDDIAFGVRNRHDGVVERRLNVRQAVMDDALLAALLEGLLPLRRAFLAFFRRCAFSGRRFCFGHVSNPNPKSQIPNPNSVGSNHDLLLRDRTLARPFARAGVGPRPLSADRQAAAMPHAAVAADFHQPLDVHRDLFAQVAFDPALLLDDAADLPDI